MDADAPYVLAMLAAETPGSAALLRGDETLGELVFEGAPRGSSALGPAVAELLKLAPGGRVDLVAVGLGPGSFTGARVGLAFARMFAFGRAAPLVGVSDLEAWALRLLADAPVVAPAIVAHDGRVFGAVYGAPEGQGAATAPPRALVDAAPFAPEAFAALAAAHGATPAHAPPARVLASDVARAALRRFRRAGRGDDLATVEPLYLEPAAPERPRP